MFFFLVNVKKRRIIIAEKSDFGYFNISYKNYTEETMRSFWKKAMVAVVTMPAAFLLMTVLPFTDGVLKAYANEGKIVGVLDAKDADENTLGMMMAGGDCNGK